MRYIIEQLEELDSVKKRRNYFNNLSDMFLGSEMPYGGTNPPLWVDDCSKESILEGLKLAEEEINRLRTLIGRKSQKLEKYVEEFERNVEQTKRLLSIPRKEIFMTPLHEFFPFFPDLEIISKQLQNSREDEIKDLSLNKKLLGIGGFASVYLAENSEGKKYAIKLFRPDWMFNIGFDERHHYRNARDRIFSNLEKNYGLFNKDPFTALVNYFYSGHSGISFHITEFFNGLSVDKIIKKGKRKTLLDDRESLAKTLITFPKTLYDLHRKNFVFGDPNWGNPLVNLSTKECKICDFDLVMPEEDIKELTHMHRRWYRPREVSLDEPPNFMSNLESFALMLDHLFVGRPLITNRFHVRRNHKEMVEKNSRQYSKQRLIKIPKGLREVVRSTITYPRDESITANDFVQAIKHEYKL